MSKKGVYAIIEHSYQPVPGTGQVEVNEKCEFVDRVKHRHETTATAIVDLLNKKLVKNRVKEATFERYIDHIRRSYPIEFSNLLKVTGLEEEYA